MKRINSKKNVLCLNQLKETLDYMIQNPDKIYIDSRKRYAPCFPIALEITYLDSICDSCREDK